MTRNLTTRAIHAALYSAILLMLMKTAAAWFTDSSAMLSEAVHSMVDAGEALVLLYGLSREEQPHDESQPFGYGRELYFWSFIVALIVFALGAGVAGYGGIARVLHPEPVSEPAVSYAVLGISFAVEGVAWIIALRAFRLTQGKLGIVEAMQQSKDPNSFTILLMESAALLGLVIAFAGISLSEATGILVFDGIASIAIGLLLCVTAVFLAYETKGLLIGERAHPDLSRSIRRIAGGQSGVRQINALNTVHLGPRHVIVLLNAGFDRALSAADVERAVELIEHGIKARHPEVEAVFIKPQSALVHRRALEADNTAHAAADN